MAMACSSSIIISGSSTITNVVPSITKPGNERCCFPSLAACPKKLLETRTGSNGLSKRGYNAIRAAKSGPVDAPSNTSRGSAPVQSHLALLERMTENSTTSPGDVTIRDQLASNIEPEVPEEVVISLANNGEKQSTTPAAELTISQKRNIRRQNYLNKSSERNDVPFFTAVAGLVLVPPILILGYAIATGYVEIFP